MLKKLILTAPIAIALLAAPALAQTPTSPATPEAKTFAKEHPRRAEVNRRLRHQTARIHEERKEGEITADQAKALHQQDAAIKKEERAEVKANGGHLTKSETKDLNKQLNGVSKQIPN